MKTSIIFHYSNGQGVHKLWGSSESNIWGVGPWGTIVHYDGNGWAKIEFDRQWSFHGITGSKESNTAYAVANSLEDVCIIAEMKNGQVNIIYKSNENTPELKSWNVNYYDQKLYLGRSDLVSTKIWEYDLLTQKTKILRDLVATLRI
jgi:hypothetical protein